MKNKLIVAAAGSGKTTFLVNAAIETPNQKILLITYTENNEREIQKKFYKCIGCIPSNVTIQTWFSFLLQHGVRPYQFSVRKNLFNKKIGFVLVEKRSGERIGYDGHPMYWGEKDFEKYYFTSDFRIYSDKISQFVFRENEFTENLVISRLTNIFSTIMIDEVQDLVGFDLEIIKLLLSSSAEILLVGDPRQVTYTTHHAIKHKKYAQGKIKDFFLNELNKSCPCEIDEESLIVSHRNNQMICDYSAKLYPDYKNAVACNCEQCRSERKLHEGIFFIRKKDAGAYLQKYKPVQLHWSRSAEYNPDYEVYNFGESKGLTFERVLIYPTTEMKKWISDNAYQLAPEVRAKLYVGITRAISSVGIVYDYKKGDNFEGVNLFDE